MSRLYQLMDQFHAAILNRDESAFAPQVLPNPRLSAQARMAIYIEGYRLRLLEAVRADYPATAALLGDVFNTLAGSYIEATPPTYFSLDRYPYAFAGYLRKHAKDPFAADLASLECAIAKTFAMEDSEALAPAALSSVTPEAFGGMALCLRRASQLLRFDYPADAYLARQRQGETPKRPAPAPSYLFVVRHENEVRRHALSQGEFLLLRQLADALPVGAALEQVAEHHPERVPEIAASVHAWFGDWTRNGFFCNPPPGAPG